MSKIILHREIKYGLFWKVYFKLWKPFRIGIPVTAEGREVDDVWAAKPIGTRIVLSSVNQSRQIAELRGNWILCVGAEQSSRLIGDSLVFALLPINSLFLDGNVILAGSTHRETCTGNALVCSLLRRMESLLTDLLQRVYWNLPRCWKQSAVLFLLFMIYGHMDVLFDQIIVNCLKIFLDYWIFVH